MSDYDLLGPDPPPPGPALKPVRLKPGQKPPAIDPTREYLLLPTGGGFRFRGYQGHVGTPTIIRADSTLSGNTKGEACGLLIDDGCSDLALEGIKATRNGHGIRLRGATRIRVSWCESWENGIEGFILGGCRFCVLNDCRSWRNGRGPAQAIEGVVGDSWTPDKRHGFYVGYHGEGNALIRCVAEDSTGLGLHVNGTADEAGPPERGLEVKQCVFRGNGSGGSGNLDLNYLSGALIEDCLIRGGNGLLATWNDGAGSTKYGAKGVTVRRSTLYQDNPQANHGIRLEKGGVVAFEACILASPIRIDSSSRVAYDAATKRGTVAEAAAWVEAGTLKSKIPGVGWQG